MTVPSSSQRWSKTAAHNAHAPQRLPQTIPTMDTMASQHIGHRTLNAHGQQFAERQQTDRDSAAVRSINAVHCRWQRPLRCGSCTALLTLPRTVQHAGTAAPTLSIMVLQYRLAVAATATPPDASVMHLPCGLANARQRSHTRIGHCRCTDHSRRMRRWRARRVRCSQAGRPQAVAHARETTCCSSSPASKDSPPPASSVVATSSAPKPSTVTEPVVSTMDASAPPLMAREQPAHRGEPGVGRLRAERHALGGW